jgi:hypothetical protein
MGKAKIDKGQVGQMFFRGGNGAVQVVGGRYHLVARIILDEIFQRRRQLHIVFDDQDLQHRTRSSPQQRTKSFGWKDMVLDPQ